MLNGSVDGKLLFLGAGLFAGIGFEGSNITSDIDMSSVGLPNYSLEIPGNNSFRVKVGGRLSFTIFDVWATSNFGSISSYTLGVTLVGLNGL